MNIPVNKILPLIKMALKEDIGRQDITSKLVIAPKTRIKAVILAKEKGVVCGLAAAKLVFKTVDKKVQFEVRKKDGRKVKKGEILARLEGNARSILKAERVALNFLGHLCGIATLTDKYVERIKPYPAKIMDTRKTTPGFRLLEKYAVRCGGGFNHRLGLWDGILVKDNHIKIQNAKFKMQNLTQLIKKVRAKIPKGIKIEIEVTNLSQLKQVLEANPDIIMLDNMSIGEIKKAVKLKAQKHSKFKGKTPRIEVSGGVNLNNVRRIATCGVEMISVGELTHSAKALDVALNCG